MLRLTLILLFAALLVVAAGIADRPASAQSALVGSWSAEQVAPGGSPRHKGTLVITQNGDELAGVMRLEGSNVSLVDVRESDGIISFSMRVPDVPNVTLNFSGAIRDNDLGVASQDL